MNSYLVSCYVIISIRKKYARGGASPPPPTRPQPMVMAIIFRFINLSIHRDRGTPRCILHISVLWVSIFTTAQKMAKNGGFGEMIANMVL